MSKLRVLSLGVLLIVGCGATQMFQALPDDLHRENVVHQTFEMTAEHFHFTPETIVVKEGTLVTLHIKSVDGTHGFALGAFGIDERLEEGATKAIEFYAPKKGEYAFKCSHICGIGHFGMSGKVVVE